LDRVLVDTGFFAAFGRRADPFHGAARRFLEDYQGQLLTVSAVVVEACHFLGPQARIDLLNWAHYGSLSVVEVPVEAYPELAKTIAKYANRDVDFADAALVWLAGETSLRRILTVDERDFGIYRLKGGKRFEVIPWMR
jgi:predicted nucleic acid-binding protein